MKESLAQEAHILSPEALLSVLRPRKFALVAASAEGGSELNAFDRALLVAGVGNTNLLKVSSILPPGAQHMEHLEIPPGVLLPIAYASICSSEPGQLISAAVAVGRASPEHYGVIMEYSGPCSAQEARAQVLRMLREGFSHRGLQLRQSLVKATEHRVQRIGCAFAAVALWF